jgi:hypothetical protein
MSCRWLPLGSYCLKRNHRVIYQQKCFQNHTSASMYPPTAIWVHGKSFTSRPHSNECNPRLSFALMMGLHPRLDENLLLHYMHDNLAHILPRHTVGGGIHENTQSLLITTANQYSFYPTMYSFKVHFYPKPERKCGTQF